MKTWGKDEDHVALKITRKELIDHGIPESDIDKGESRGSLKTIGPWGIPVSFRALAMTCVYVPKEKQRYTAETESITMYGRHTLSNVHESGYELEGLVTVNGKTYRGFTSSQLFELEDGKLVDVAIIHVCM